jgi:hypothetical protein
MKLLLCFKCNDVFSLKTSRMTTCICGQTSGQYLNNLDAEVSGVKDKFVVLGFDNMSLVEAIRAQLLLGDSQEKMLYGSREVTKGRDFRSFVIPDSSQTVKRIYTDATS